MNKLDKVLGVYRYKKCKSCICLMCKYHTYKGCEEWKTSRTFCQRCKRLRGNDPITVCSSFKEEGGN